MPEDEFVKLFSPGDLFSTEYINVTFHFDNGNIDEYRENVAFRKKGIKI
jgi:hypothetical protein